MNFIHLPIHPHQINVCVCMREIEREEGETERETQKETHTERDIDTHRDTEMDTETHRQRGGEKQRAMHTEIERDREKENVVWFLERHKQIQHQWQTREVILPQSSLVIS